MMAPTAQYIIPNLQLVNILMSTPNKRGYSSVPLNPHPDQVELHRRGDFQGGEGGRNTRAYTIDADREGQKRGREREGDRERGRRRGEGGGVVSGGFG